VAASFVEKPVRSLQEELRQGGVNWWAKPVTPSICDFRAEVDSGGFEGGKGTPSSIGKKRQGDRARTGARKAWLWKATSSLALKD